MKRQSELIARTRTLCLVLLMTMLSGSAAWAACDSSSYAFGAGKYDITGPAAEQGMMGYAQIDQKSYGIHMRQWARAFNIKECDGGSEVLIVVADVGQLFESIRQGVLNKLETLYGAAYTYKNVMLSATHTHQGAGGYSHRDLYNLTTLGYSSQTYNAIVNGIVEAIELAVANRQNNTEGTKIYWDRELAIDGDLKGSFNRSLAAYNNNSVKFPFLEQYGGIDLYARQLTFIDNGSGEVTGIINSFGVHPTTLGNTNKYLSSDSKGYSAWYTEQAYPNVVAAFPNGWDGDMSANFDGIPSNTDEDYADMKEMGRLYADKAILMADTGNRAATSTLLSGPIKYEARYVELPGLDIPNTFTGSGIKTLCDPALGFSFAAGSTEDGEGSDMFSEGMVSGEVDSEILSLGLAMDYVTSECQAEKPVLLYTNVDILGAIQSILSSIDGLGTIIEDVFTFLAGDILEDDAWTEITVPVQLMQIGGMTIYPLPYESTVTAGAALQDKVGEITGESDMHLPIGLANGYVGYVTTRDEYAKQHYEGASVHFGPYTNNGFTYLYYRLAEKMMNGTSIDDIAEASPEDLSGSLWDLQSEVVFDDSPIYCHTISSFPFFECEETYGKVLSQPNGSYTIGDTVKVEFQSGHPKNDLQTMGTFLQVQKMVDGNWVDYINDDNPRTFYKWIRSDGANSKVWISWVTNSEFDAEGTYRIKHYGDYKHGFTGNIHSFNGTSDSFTLETLPVSLFDTVAKFDFSGTANGTGSSGNISISGDPWTNDRSGNADSAYAFDGNDILYGEWEQAFSDEMSISVWFRANPDDKNSRLVEFDAGGGDAGTAIEYTASGKLSAWCQNQGSTSQDRGGALYNRGSDLNDGQWHHAVFVHSGSGIKLYADGAQIGFTSNHCSDIDDAGYISMGGYYFNSNYNRFDGDIDEVRIYDKALTAGEVDELYSATPDVDTVARFDFSGTANGIGYSDNISMTNSGDPWTNDRSGSADSAYAFDGNDILYGEWEQAFADEMAISVWFRANPDDMNSRLVEFDAGGGDAGTAIEYTASGKLSAWCQNQGSTSQDRGGAIYHSGSDLNDGQWHHAVFVHSSDGMKLYADGAQIGSTSNHCSDIDDAGYISMGGYYFNSNYNRFDGDIDEVKIFDKALTADEVKELYSAAGFYEHAGYNAEDSGYAVFLPSGQYTKSLLDSRGIGNDALSSIKINNSSYQVVVFEHDDFEGNSVIVYSSEDYLGDAGINDAVTSMKIESKSSESAYMATFYEDGDYSSGSSYIVSLPPGEYIKSELTSRNFGNDALSSVKIYNSDYQVVLFEHDEFKGNSIILDQSNADLEDTGLNDEATSIKIELKSSSSSHVATFYEDGDYSSGSSYIVSLPPGSYTLSQLQARGITNDSLTSLTINNSDYKVILYQHDNYGGSSVTIDSDTDDLTSYGFNNQTSSIVIEEK